ESYSATTDMYALAPNCTTRVRDISDIRTVTDIPSSNSRSRTDSTYPDAVPLSTLAREANPSSSAGTVRTFRARRSYSSIDSTTWLTSHPYAPTFWMGVAPAQPGMPERHSSPPRPAATVAAT